MKANISLDKDGRIGAISKTNACESDFDFPNDFEIPDPEKGNYSTSYRDYKILDGKLIHDPLPPPAPPLPSDGERLSALEELATAMLFGGDLLA